MANKYKTYKTRELVIDKAGNKRYKYTHESGRHTWSGPLKGPKIDKTVASPTHANYALYSDRGVISRIISILQSKPVEQHTTTESEILAHLAAAGYVKLKIEIL